MDKTVQRVVEYIFDRLLPAGQKTATDDELEAICSLASDISAGEKIRLSEKRGLSSIFDMLYTRQGEAAAGNILRYDNKKRIFTRCKNGAAEQDSDLPDIGAMKKMLSEINEIDRKFEFLKQYAADIPCTKGGELSLYAYTKLWTAFASAMALYYKQKETGLSRPDPSENSLVLYTADFSGIQNFIYTIINEKALKTLRAKSFFIELVMAQLTSEIISCFGLTEANVLYSGGGHCYLLLPTVDMYKDKLKQIHGMPNKWSIENFSNSLSVIWETQECSPDDFTNKSGGAYKKLFSSLSAKMAAKKLCKYSPAELKLMNEAGRTTDGKRECRICGASSHMVRSDSEGICEWCNTFRAMSEVIIDREQCFAVLKRPSGKSVPFFSYQGEVYFYYGSSQDIYRQIKEDNVIRIFCKNEEPTGLVGQFNDIHIIDVCDYSDNKNLEAMVSESRGISRLSVLRMDVDNLGSTFISGFNIMDRNGDPTDKSYVNISRTAALSTQLTSFFKNNLTYILEQNNYHISVLYAGGDDVFLVGSWDNVINAGIEIIKEFKDLTGGKLTASAGIGIYKSKYPVARFAAETELLEACSKKNPRHDKDSVTLFSGDGSQTYSWEEFQKRVIGEKLTVLRGFIKDDSQKGNSFLYKLLDYLRRTEQTSDRINIARAAYLLGRMCDELSNNKEQRKDFSERVFSWIISDSDTDRKQLITAIYIFVYQERSAK